LEIPQYSVAGCAAEEKVYSFVLIRRGIKSHVYLSQCLFSECGIIMLYCTLDDRFVHVSSKLVESQSYTARFQP
jgi:hypothetical protein